MSRTVVRTHATLDRMVDAPPEALLPYQGDEARQAALDAPLQADALLLGRATWHRLAGAWRGQTGPLADRLPALPKHVVTSTPLEGDVWQHSVRTGYDEVAGLRDRFDLLG